MKFVIRFCCRSIGSNVLICRENYIAIEPESCLCVVFDIIFFIFLKNEFCNISLICHFGYLVVKGLKPSDATRVSGI